MCATLHVAVALERTHVDPVVFARRGTLTLRIQVPLCLLRRPRCDCAGVKPDSFTTRSTRPAQKALKPLVLVFVCSLPETFHSQRQTLPLAELLFQPKSHELPDGILITVDAKRFRCADICRLRGRHVDCDTGHPPFVFASNIQTSSQLTVRRSWSSPTSSRIHTRGADDEPTLVSLFFVYSLGPAFQGLKRAQLR